MSSSLNDMTFVIHYTRIKVFVEIILSYSTFKEMSADICLFILPIKSSIYFCLVQYVLFCVLFTRSDIKSFTPIYLFQYFE